MHQLPPAYREDRESDYSFVLYLYLPKILPAADDIHVIWGATFSSVSFVKREVNELTLKHLQFF